MRVEHVSTLHTAGPSAPLGSSGGKLSGPAGRTEAKSSTAPHSLKQGQESPLATGFMVSDTGAAAAADTTPVTEGDFTQLQGSCCCVCPCCERGCAQCCIEDCSPRFQMWLAALVLLWGTALCGTILGLLAHDPFVWTYDKKLAVLIGTFVSALLLLLLPPFCLLYKRGRDRRQKERRRVRERLERAQLHSSNSDILDNSRDQSKTRMECRLILFPVLTVLVAIAATVGVAYRPRFVVNSHVLEGMQPEGIAVIFLDPNLFLNASKPKADPALARQYSQEALRIDWNVLDVRAKGFERGHLPGALHLSVKVFLNNENTGSRLPSAEHMTHIFHETGFDARRPTLVYGDWNYGRGEEFYIYWILRYMGVRSASLLYGGVWAYVFGYTALIDQIHLFIAWTSANLPLDVGYVIPRIDPSDGPNHLHVEDVVPDVMALLRDVQAGIAEDAKKHDQATPDRPDRLPGETVVIPWLFDAREEKNFQEGHLPFAHNLPWDDTIQPDGNLLERQDFLSYLTKRDLLTAMDNSSCIYSAEGLSGSWVWTSLLWYGAHDIKLFSGGSDAWVAEGLKLVT